MQTKAFAWIKNECDERAKIRPAVKFIKKISFHNWASKSRRSVAGGDRGGREPALSELPEAVPSALLFDCGTRSRILQPEAVGEFEEEDVVARRLEEVFYVTPEFEVAGVGIVGPPLSLRSLRFLKAERRMI